MNARSKVSSKGQIVVPKDIRDRLGFAEGSEVEFIEGPQGVVLKPVKSLDDRFPLVSPEEFMARRLHLDRPFPSDEEIAAGLVAEASRRLREKSD